MAAVFETTRSEATASSAPDAKGPLEQGCDDERAASAPKSAIDTYLEARARSALLQQSSLQDRPDYYSDIL